MASLAAIHDAITYCLDTIDGLRAFPGPPQGVSPPVAYVLFKGWDPKAFGRNAPPTCQFSVYVFTAAATRPQDGYTALLQYADFTGAKSIKLAIWDGHVGDVFAGLAETQAAVTHFEALGAEQVDAYQAYGGVFTVTVTTT